MLRLIKNTENTIENASYLELMVETLLPALQ